MHIEIKKVDMEIEVGRLVEMEAQIFSSSDRLRADALDGTECFWLVVDGAIAGLTALRRDYVVSESRGSVQCTGGVYIVSTGILPEFQGMGLGKKLKEWQISYAKSEGFVRMTTTCRESNARMIGLNEKFGFKALYTIPNCYRDPKEPGIVMELNIS